DRGQPRQTAPDRELMRLRQTLLDLRPEGIDVPGQVPVALSQDVVEAPGLDQLDPARTDHAEHHPARGGAPGDHGDRPRADGGHRARSARDTGRFGRPGGRCSMRGVAAHRRNAAATPASTGTCRPVVWVRSPAVSANTALATVAGNTSRLSRVRWA